MIKFSVANINNKLINDVNSVLKSGCLTHGRFTEMFESEIKKFTGSKYCTLVSSCTAALHLSCLALKLKKGDEVIVPAGHIQRQLMLLNIQVQKQFLQILILKVEILIFLH